MIDPACGSGHFLLGSLRRILERWQKKEPRANARDLIQRTLDSIHGVDVNPYAVAIARFRLLLVAMKTCGVTLLADAPAFRFNLVCGDSLLHGVGAQASFGWHDFDHVYQAEDQAELVRILKPGHYHAVVANPPYITPKDKTQNDAYRERYSTCHRKYSLAVPFMQRLFQLAISGYGDEQQKGGFVGQITANSFMKREFGKKLIEEYFAGRGGSPGRDLTHVIDTSGAYIPGHGTPTVVLFGRHRAPVAKTIRTVMGIRGEPSTPDNPAQGIVWSAIVSQIDQPGSQSGFVSVADSQRELFHKHPWSIGGGGAAELKEQLEENAAKRLGTLVNCIGFGAILGEDEAFGDPISSPRMRLLPPTHRRVVVEGDQVRDWRALPRIEVLFPYTNDIQLCSEDVIHKWFWPLRTVLWGRNDFSKSSYRDCGRPYWEYHQIPVDRNRAPLSIAYSEVATHNHFVLDRGGKVFKQTAPVIKLPPEATVDDHLALLGLLNSSAACFWLKQVCHNKGAGGGTRVEAGLSTMGDDMWECHFAFNATKLQPFPMPDNRPVQLARQLDGVAGLLSELSPSALLRTTSAEAHPEILVERRRKWEVIRGQMIALQEELDWECYRLYGLTEEDLTLWREDAKKDEEHNSLCALAPLREIPALQLGQRAFEFLLARRMAAGELQTTWFERHGSTPGTEIPAEWPDDYKRLVERRIELIEKDRNIALVEQPEYKRRWNTEPWESQLERALRSWLLDRLETYSDFDGRMNDEGKPTAKLDIVLTSVSRLADVARQDADFMQVGEVYRDDPAFNIDRLVAELVEAESVPLLPILRYKPSGVRKRAEWEQTWDRQREEDRAGTRLDIPVPPKYTSADFLKSDYWRLRGKLDVPKERWVSFPHCEGPDGTLVIAWAGYDHLQLARSISAYYVDIQERLGGRDDPRLIPLLACLLELLPWLKQWHNELDPEFGERMGDYFEGFVNEEARQLGKTVPEIRAWEPVKKAGGRKKK